jgi:putative ABC transport system permease protein
MEFIKISIKSLLLNKIRSFLTMLGIIIGVSAVIILTSIVGGLQKTITDQFKSFGSNSLYLFPGVPGGGRGPGGTVVNKLQFSFSDRIQSVNGVTDVSALVNSTGTVKYKNKDSKNVVVYGVEDNYLSLTSFKVTEGEFISRGDVSGGKLVAVIGQTIKTKLFENENPIGKSVYIKNKKFEVIAVMQKRGAVFGADQDNQVYIPISVARSRFQIDKPNFFYIKVDETQNIKAIQKNIEKVISQFIDKDEFSVISQEQSIDFITNILGILATALGGIAAISLLVGGVGIMNIMFVSVTERTREIGLRKAVGANSTNILMQFLWEAIILSLLGGLIGVIFGVLMSLLIGNFLDTALNPFYIALSFGVSAVIGIVFGTAPAIKASKMDPISALRYE